MNVFAAGSEIRSEFADYLFENVLECDDASHSAVLIDNNGHTFFLFLKVKQLSVQRRAFRNEVGLASFLQQSRFVELFDADKLARAAQVQNADDVIDIVLVDR